MNLRVLLKQFKTDEQKISVYLTPEFQRIGIVESIGVDYIIIFEKDDDFTRRWIIPIDKINNICVR